MLTGVTMRVLAHPFHLAADRAIAVVDQGSDGNLDQLIQTVVGTVVGEREMCQAYGIPDPVWHGIEAADIQASLSLFGPDVVVIQRVDTTWQGETEAKVTVLWERDDVTSAGSDQP